MSYFIRAAQLNMQMTHAEVVLAIVDRGFARRHPALGLPVAFVQTETSVAMQPMFLGGRTAIAAPVSAP
jgi:hypothetical protein